MPNAIDSVLESTVDSILVTVFHDFASVFPRDPRCSDGSETHLNVLCERVEDLFGYIDCFGEIALALLIEDVFPGVVPVEITDGLLRTHRARVCVRCVSFYIPKFHTF